MRAAAILKIGTGLAVILSPALSGCHKFKRNDAAEPARLRAQVKRQQAACASPAANDRLKDSIFDEAIAKRNGDRANLDVLADYSVARMQDPLVKGWDPSLDITRCKARFIVEVPPGAERAFNGSRELKADIQYTAQASADGAGYVYQQKGAEPIVAKLATFNLGPVAYRPSPAIDQPGTTTGTMEQASVAEAAPASSLRNPPPPAPAPHVQAALPQSVPRREIADQLPRVRRFPEPTRASPETAEATVRAFYRALEVGNGKLASAQVIPAKRSSGAFSPAAISRFYGRLPEPIRLSSIVPVAAEKYRVTYRYSAGRSHCNGSAIVTVTGGGEHDLIRSIQSLSGC